MTTIAASQVLNPSFEEPGGLPGTAFGWTMTTIATYEELAYFSDETVDGTIEDFSDWTPGALFSFDTTDLSRCVFDATTLSAEAVEDFEEFWSDNHHALETLTGASLDGAVWGDLFEDAETFDWNVLLEELSSVSGASFAGGGDVEAFEDEWNNGVHIFVWAHTPLYLSTAIFDAAPLVLYEDFEDEWSLTLTGL